MRKPYCRLRLQFYSLDDIANRLLVAAEIAKYLPNERIVYYADTAYVPYGPRSDEEIRELTARAVSNNWKVFTIMLTQMIKAKCGSRIAGYDCNFTALTTLKPAVLQTRSKVVAVLATPATFRGQLIKDVVEKSAPCSAAGCKTSFNAFKHASPIC
jgi:glutamate racemase